MKKILPILLIPLLSFIFLKFNTRFWDGNDKVSVAFARSNGSVEITTFDPGNDEITDISIPADTEVVVARGLGTFKIKSISAIGENEKVGGVLLSETITKNFRFPTYIWVDPSGKTNQALGDRLNLALFSFGKKHTEIDLSQTSYLIETRLKDGTAGFTVSGKLPEKIAAIFADSEAGKGNLKVNIEDGTRTFGIAKKVGEIVEVLGAKTALISNVDVENSDCKVSGKEKRFAKKVANIFSCELANEKPDGNFDLVISLGEAFAKRF